LIGQEEVVGATDALLKRNLFKKEKASSFQSVMFQKQTLIGWRETFGMLDLGIVDEGDPDQKNQNQRQLKTNQGVGGYSGV
jgi:hypothetical protein